MYKKKSLQKQKQKEEKTKTKQQIDITRFIGLQDHITRFLSASICAHLLSSGKPQSSQTVKTNIYILEKRKAAQHLL